MAVVLFASSNNALDAHLKLTEPAAYLSCPTSPTAVTLIDAPQFYSAPSSPTRGLAADPFVLERGSEKKTRRDSTSDSDDFEFGVSVDESRRMSGKRKAGDAAATMAFADELFSDGRVLPLKLPPRLLSASLSASATSAPRSSSSSILRAWTFKRKDADVDPFAAALEEVTKEEGPQTCPPPLPRRSRSHSPNITQCREQTPEKTVSKVAPTLTTETEASTPPGCRRSDRKQPVRAESLAKSDLETPARATRSYSERPRGKNERRPTSPKRSTSERPPKSISETGKSTLRRSFFENLLLFRSASEGRADKKDKLRPRTVAIQNSGGRRGLSFRSAHRVHYKGSSTQAVKKTSLSYRPAAMFDCVRLRAPKNRNCF